MKADLLSTHKGTHWNQYKVEEFLNSLSVGKGAVPDGINNIILKQLSKPLSKPLSDLFHFSLVHGNVSTTWKEANISPIFKKNDPSEISIYRSFLLLDAIGKALFISMFIIFQRQQCIINFTIRCCTW